MKLIKCTTSIIFVFIILLFNSPTKVLSDTVATYPDFNQVDKYINSYVESTGIPGLSIGIVKDNQIVYLKGFGRADNAGRSVTPQTPFILGSTSKSFTAMAVMQLVDEGKIQLDDPVQKYLPWFRVVDLEASSKITIRYLLNHTSGMSRNAAYPLMSKSDLNDLEKYIHKLKKVKLSQSVGTTFQYSNEGYQILGLIVQSVSGQSFGDYVDRRIFEPLQMRHSYSSKVEAKMNGLAEGHRVVFGFPIASDLMYPKAYIPCGYLITSSEDMCNYLICQMNGGVFENTSVVSSAAINEMHKSTVKFKNKDLYYGMGWASGSTNGVYTIKHDGAVEDYYSYMAIIPEGNWGIVILSNVDNVLIDYNPVSNMSKAIISYLGGKQLPAIKGSYYKSYVLIDFIVLLVIIGLLSRVWTIKRWAMNIKSHKVFRTVTCIVAVYFLIPAIILLGFPIISEYPWHYAVSYSPDIAFTLLFGSIYLIILGFTKLILIACVTKNRYSKLYEEGSK